MSIENIDINKIALSNKVSSSKKVFKYFISNKDAKKFRPLCILLTKMSWHRTDFVENKHMSFLIKLDEFLEKYKKIWEKVSNNIKKRIL